MEQPRPFWLPDTQGFLAIAIITLMGGIVLTLLMGDPPKFDDKTAGALMMVLGVMTACLKDVYSFFFGSSKGSEKKDDVIMERAITAPVPPVPTPPIPTITTTTTDDGTVTRTEPTPSPAAPSKV